MAERPQMESDVSLLNVCMLLLFSCSVWLLLHSCYGETCLILVYIKAEAELVQYIRGVKTL
jgi:hypothetical protein